LVRWLTVAAGLVLLLFALWQAGRQLERGPTHAKSMSAAPPILKIGTADPADLLKQILRDEEVDERVLAEIEKQGNPTLAAEAYFVAARYEYQHKHRESALRLLQRALNYAPDLAGLHEWQAALLLEAGQYAEAVMQGERAVQLQPNSANAQRLLGLAYYDSGRNQEAVEAWNRSLQLAPDQEVKKYLEKAQREARVEEKFTQTARGHFVLRYEGGQPGEALTEELLRVLEQQYDDLTRELGSSPAAPVTVTLYSAQQFSDVTQAPAWAAAVNDGKMRVPVGDVTTVTLQLQAVLRHELTHSFIHAAVPHCPVWLNEGLAQFEERKDLAGSAGRLAIQLRSGEAPPLRQLEGSFLELGPEQAQMAYAESLAAVEYLRSAYGLTGLQRLLGLLSDGETPEGALRKTTLGGYEDLQRNVVLYVASHS